MGPVSLGINLVSQSRSLGVPYDYPIARRDLLREDEDFILLENGTDKIVITFGTFDSLLLEDATFLLREDSGKLIIQAN